MKIPHVHVKTAKGRTYYYFDTGARNAKGRAILKRLPDPSHPTFARALADAKRVRNMRGKTQRAVLTVSGLADLFEASPHWRELAAASRRNYRIYLDVIRDQIGKAPVGDVTRADAVLLLDKLAEKPSAANMTIRTLGALYAWAVKRGYATESPVRDIDYHPEGEHQPWPEWLLDEALASDDALVKLATSLLYYTGQRIGDVLAMQWTSIRDGRIEVRQQKTGATLAIRIHADLEALLTVTPRHGLTILAQANSRRWSQEAVRTKLQAFAAERGVKVVPHGLRKNAVNALLDAGCSMAEVSAITGQSLQMIEHYAKGRNKTRHGDSAILKLERKRK